MAGWSNKPTAFINVIETSLKERRNDAAKDALQMVVRSAPVDTGAFRGNNRVSVDSEDHTFDLDATDKSGQETISAGIAVIDKADKPYQAVTIQNNLPYAEVLENGHSQQAPQGVYGPAFEAVRSKYAK